MSLEGAHHVTAICADAPRNVDFYGRVLGLRLVKKTVNFDAPADPEGLAHEQALTPLGRPR
jgi:glyoxalase family protein